MIAMIAMLLCLLWLGVLIVTAVALIALAGFLAYTVVQILICWIGIAGLVVMVIAGLWVGQQIDHITGCCCSPSSPSLPLRSGLGGVSAVRPPSGNEGRAARPRSRLVRPEQPALFDAIRYCSGSSPEAPPGG
jgi:hypothetical protein